MLLAKVKGQIRTAFFTRISYTACMYLVQCTEQHYVDSASVFICYSGHKKTRYQVELCDLFQALLDWQYTTFVAFRRINFLCVGRDLVRGWLVSLSAVLHSRTIYQKIKILEQLVNSFDTSITYFRHLFAI